MEPSTVGTLTCPIDEVATVTRLRTRDPGVDEPAMDGSVGIRMRTLPTSGAIGHAPIAAGTSADAPETAVARLRAALDEAAEAAVAAGVDLEPWMQAAWTAYVEHRPGLRQHLEDVQLAHQLDELRQRGQVPKA
jgi:hypothetical protein